MKKGCHLIFGPASPATGPEADDWLYFCTKRRNIRPVYLGSTRDCVESALQLA